MNDSPSGKPNIVLITSHDLGQHLGCYGIETAKTPHIDRLAKHGARFANSFCTAPQCSPSRAAIATGRYPHSNGVMGLTHADHGWDLHDNEIHFAKWIHDHGWYSSLVGVQHETRSSETIGFDQITKPDVTSGEHRRPSAADIAVLAADFIQQWSGKAQPFYLQVGFFEPHRAPELPTGFLPSSHDPVESTTVPGFLINDRPTQEEFSNFEASLRAVDDAVGTILDALESTGIAPNTLILFTADHGIPFPRAKCSLYDPGLEVPLIIRWPAGPVTQAVEYHELVSNVDYVPSLCELVGIPTPPGVQGVSFAPLIMARRYDARSDVFAEMTYHSYYDPLRAVRTDTHKLILSFAYNRAFMDPSTQWRPVTRPVVPSDPARANHPLVELYDLRTDPLEHQNLAEDPSVALLRRTLLGRLYNWMESTDDPLLHGIPMPRRHYMALKELRAHKDAERSQTQ